MLDINWASVHNFYLFKIQKNELTSYNCLLTYLYLILNYFWPKKLKSIMIDIHFITLKRTDSFILLELI